MLVSRQTFKVKLGRMEELVALARTGGDLLCPPHAWRLYSSDIGPMDVLAFEFEFDGLQEYERYWAEWSATPGAAAFLEKWYELVENARSNKVWTLEASQ